MTSLRKKGKVDVVAVLLLFMLAVLIGILISSIFSTIEMFKMSKKESGSLMPQKISRMSLTSFDKELAIEFMDKNHDGRCDVCGMPVEQCIDGGQLECSMDTNAKIGILGSQHIHADFKVYIDGKSINFANRNYYMKSSFIHLDDNQNKEDASGVLHMHATGVPLWIFFKSIGMDFNKDCITLENKENFCNSGNKKLRFFVNGKENNEFKNYVFNDLDNILISYGNENEEEIKNQLNTITDFAKSH